MSGEEEMDEEEKDNEKSVSLSILSSEYVPIESRPPLDPSNLMSLMFPERDYIDETALSNEGKKCHSVEDLDGSPDFEEEQLIVDEERKAMTNEFMVDEEDADLFDAEILQEAQRNAAYAQESINEDDDDWADILAAAEDL